MLYHKITKEVLFVSPFFISYECFHKPFQKHTRNKIALISVCMCNKSRALWIARFADASTVN